MEVPLADSIVGPSSTMEVEAIWWASELVTNVPVAPELRIAKRLLLAKQLWLVGGGGIATE